MSELHMVHRFFRIAAFCTFIGFALGCEGLCQDLPVFQAGEVQSADTDVADDVGVGLGDAGEEPDDTGEEPEDTGERPEDTGEEPDDTDEEPEDTGEDSEDIEEEGCPEGLEDCDGECVDLEKNIDRCGYCDFPCEGPAYCSGGITCNPFEFEVEVIDDESGYSEIGGMDPSLVVDAEDNPHVSYTARDSSGSVDVRYAWLDPDDGWQVDVLDSGTGNSAVRTSLAIDDDGSSHVAYVAGGLYYLKGTPGDWSDPEELAGVPGHRAKVAIDSQGLPHIVTSTNFIGDISYATMGTNGVWTEATTIAEGTEADRIWMDLDSDDNVHVIYTAQIPYPDLTYELYYARNDSGSWDIEQIDPGFALHEDADIAVDDESNVHIALSHHGGFRMMYAYREYAGTDWEIEEVDDQHDVGQSTSLALDAQGRPHMVYRQQFGALSLRYAVRKDGQWWPTTVDDEGSGLNNSLGIDSHGWPHIGFNHRIGTDEFRYATFPAD